MTWPTDTEQIATINKQAERIHQLKDQVTRLQRVALLEWESYYNIGLHFEQMSDDAARRYADSVTGLRPADLDPIE